MPILLLLICREGEAVFMLSQRLSDSVYFSVLALGFEPATPNGNPHRCGVLFLPVIPEWDIFSSSKIFMDCSGENVML